MDALTFFGLEQSDVPTRWEMPVIPELCSGMGALFGGVGLGAAIEAMEHTTGRPCVWATAQYLSFTRPPAVLTVDVVEVVRGHRTSQARATVRSGDEEILTVNASLGTRPFEGTGSWAVRPDVPPPRDCTPRTLLPRHRGTIMDRIEARFADARDVDELDGTPGDGRSALWVRIPDLQTGAAALAIVGDYVPFGISQALGLRAGGNSLDNTLRIAHRAPSEWILADIRIHAVVDGFGHGLVHLWGDEGTLLGTASQSAMVRPWRDRPPEGAQRSSGG